MVEEHKPWEMERLCSNCYYGFSYDKYCSYWARDRKSNEEAKKCEGWYDLSTVEDQELFELRNEE